MSKIWVCSDLHFGHKAIAKYRKLPDGTDFNSADHHDAWLIGEILKQPILKRDTVYFLGDIIFSKDKFDLIDAIPCENKVLFVGNHDFERVPAELYLSHFSKIHMATHRNVGGFKAWFSHFPIHESELRGKFCFHGHCHGANRFLPKEHYFDCGVENLMRKFGRPIELLTNIASKV